MSIVKSILIYGCAEGSTGASLAMALAGKAVHVFACSQSGGQMNQLGDIPNLSTLTVNPASQADEEPIRELIATHLRGGQLNIFINMGSVGQKGDRQPSAGRGLELWAEHVRSLLCLSRALKPFLIASNGIIIDFIDYELLVQDSMISKFPCSYCIFINPLTIWQDQRAVDPAGIAFTTGRLRGEFEPLNVKVLTIAHGGEQEFTNMNEGESATWPDVPALAMDIIRDIFRLPGEGRVL